MRHQRKAWARGVVLASVLLAAASARPAAAALNVPDVRWGFARAAVPERVNILSVLVENPGAEPYEGVVDVSQHMGVGGRVGIAYAQAVYVGAHASRWLQFYPYVGDADARWTLDGPGVHADLGAPRFGPPEVVQLEPAGDTAGRRTELAAFPEDLFPPTVAATDGLEGVVLAHVPRWGPAQRQAFAEWLYRGGTVHVAQAPGGGRPVFDGDLSVLNGESPRSRVGAGLVLRHALPAAALDRAALREAGQALARLDEGEQGYGFPTDQSLLGVLGGPRQPKHDWGLIYVCLVGYVIAVAPVGYLIGRRARGVLRPTVAFLGSVAAFTFVMVMLGRRGYAEVQAVRSLSYARPVAEDAYDVTQWIDAFVTRGGTYEFRHAADFCIYANPSSVESVRAVALAGKGGCYRADIPLYSAQSLVHRSRMAGPRLGVRVVQWPSKDAKAALAVEVGDGFPQDMLRASALVGGRFVRMERRGSRLQGAGVPSSPAQFLGKAQLDAQFPTGWNLGYGYRDAGDTTDVRSMLQSLFPFVVGRALGDAEWLPYRVVADGPTDPDAADLFVLTESPDSFAVQGAGAGSQVGYTVYHVRLHRPEAADE